MSEQEELNLFEKISEGLAESYEQLLRRKAALGQDMVFADENGRPRIVPAAEELVSYLKSRVED
ncbi:MAG: hypothetical protein HDS68_07425 [Bacteroidales bacterium]|nr:hypothetical protein [Bacteroidales bacterium]